MDEREPVAPTPKYTLADYLATRGEVRTIPARHTLPALPFDGHTEVSAVAARDIKDLYELLDKWAQMPIMIDSFPDGATRRLWRQRLIQECGEEGIAYNEQSESQNKIRENQVGPIGELCEYIADYLDNLPEKYHAAAQLFHAAREHAKHQVIRPENGGNTEDRIIQIQTFEDKVFAASTALAEVLGA